MYPARRNTKFFDNISQKPISISEDFDSNNNLVEKEFNPAIESSDNKYLLHRLKYFIANNFWNSFDNFIILMPKLALSDPSGRKRKCEAPLRVEGVK